LGRKEDTLSDRFRGLIKRAFEKTGKKVVVLVDEYDKPLTETLNEPESHDKIRRMLKGFYGVLKSADQYLRFVMLTGVTKFSQVSVFSDLNQLRDISMDKNYAEICGITEMELLNNFKFEIQALADDQNLSYDDTLAKLKYFYDGYHFAKKSEDIYNPFSLLNAFASRDFGYYWFKTGTPTFLAAMLKKNDFSIPDLENGISISQNAITNYRVDSPDPIPLLYQSGYLTVKNYIKEYGKYQLGFPNTEVRVGFLESLCDVYLPALVSYNGLSTTDFVDDMKAGNVDSLMNRFKALFATIPYQLVDKHEKYYHSILFTIFTLTGQYVKAEVSMINGRSDAVVEVQDYIYIFEFKLLGNGTAERALKQIDDKGYSIPYQATGKKIVKIGVEFDPETRTIGRWLVADKNKKIAKKIAKKVSKKVIKKVNKKVTKKANKRTVKKVVKKSSGKKNS
jgi:hypothetical protein